MSTGAQNGAFIPVLKASDSGRLMIVYNQRNDQDVTNPYFRDSVDGGKSWRQPAAIQNSGTDLFQVDFDFDDDGNAHAVWRTQYGVWHAPEAQWPFSANAITSTTKLVLNPDIATAPDGALHAVWAQDFRIYHAFSSDGGNSWSPSEAIAGDVFKSDEPAVDVDGDGDVHVVWEDRILDEGSFRYEIRYLSGFPEETTISWEGPPITLSTGVADAQRPAIVTQSNVVHVAFAYRAADDAQYAYYVHHDPVNGWSQPVDVTNGDPVAVNANDPFVLIPELILCDGTPHVYFHGSLAAGAKELIIGVTEADGWSARDHLRVANVRAIHPSPACVNGVMHMVYEVPWLPNQDHQVYYTLRYLYGTYLPVVIRS